MKAPVETWHWPIFLVKTPSDCCLLCCNPCSTLVVFPYPLPSRWYLPILCHSASAASPFNFILFCVIIVLFLFLPPVSQPSLCLLSLADQLNIGLYILVVIALSLPSAREVFCLIICVLFLLVHELNI